MALSLADTIMGAMSVFLPLAGAILFLGYAVVRPFNDIDE